MAERIFRQRPPLSREYVAKSLFGLLDTAERPGWWGEIAIALVVQNGRVETIKRRTEQTDKGATIGMLTV